MSTRADAAKLVLVGDTPKFYKYESGYSADGMVTVYLPKAKHKLPPTHVFVTVETGETT